MDLQKSYWTKDMKTIWALNVGRTDRGKNMTVTCKESLEFLISRKMEKNATK